ncbi:hypothetical protein PIB30_077034 [Stylosanthes scabra]|uniref:Uncharacterized protein n=1 Tax=Stylosanthes scabra TaxID=79078 RepID=A0ABU6ZP66_9FABA|nr:hypothetical protein [Stylosanthes scabra]
MDRKRNQAALKGKEKVRTPPTRMSPRLAVLKAPQSPPLKRRTPPSRALPRLVGLRDSLLPPSPTSMLMPKKLLVLALAAPKPTTPSVTPRRFPERVITKGEPSRAAPKEEVVIDASSNSEVNKEVEDAPMELIAMDEPLILEEEDEEEEEEDPKEEEDEDPEAEEEVLEHFRDDDDYEDYFSAEDDNSLNGSIGSN